MAWSLAVLHNKMGAASGGAGLLVVMSASAGITVLVMMFMVVMSASAGIAVLVVMFLMIVPTFTGIAVFVVMFMMIMSASTGIAVLVMEVVVAVPAGITVFVMVVAVPAVITVLVVMLMVIVPTSAGIAMFVCMSMSGAGFMRMMTCAVIIVRVFRRYKFYFHYDISSQYMNKCSYVYLIIYILLCQGGNLGNGKLFFYRAAGHVVNSDSRLFHGIFTY